MMENYNGQLVVESDGPRNVGAMASLLDFIHKSIDYGKVDSKDERALLEQGMQIALQKYTPTTSLLRMKFDNFTIECMIGFGSFGKIWKADFTPPRGQPRSVALKQLQNSISNTPSLWKERDLLIFLKHQRICNLIGAFVHHDVFFVMQLCYGSVSKLKTRITKANVARFTIHLLEAIKWIHSRGIIHADIKSDNCLISETNDLVLSDFGSAIILKDDETKVSVIESHGSPGFLDLEANRDLLFSKSTDMFSAGCVIFEMDTKQHLLFYRNQEQTRELYVDALVHGRIISLPSNSPPTAPAMERETLEDRALNSSYVHLLKKMICENQNRITASEAIIDETLRVVTKQWIAANKRNKQDYVTREHVMDTSQVFEFVTDPTPYNPGLLGFYHDEEQQEDSQEEEKEEYEEEEEEQEDEDDEDDDDSDDPPPRKIQKECDRDESI